MENQENSKQDCGCSDGCCTPKKKNNLRKIVVSLVIILAAGTITAVKLVSKQAEPPVKCCTTPTNLSCCPQTAKQDTVPAKCCSETSENSPCCSQSN